MSLPDVPALDRLHERPAHIAHAPSHWGRPLAFGGDLQSPWVGAAYFAEHALRSALAVCNAGLKVSLANSWPAVAPAWLVKGQYAASVQPLGDVLPRPRMIVSVDLSDARGQRESVPVPLDVTCWAWVSKLTVDVKRLAPLKAEDIAPTALDLTALSADTVRRLLLAVPSGPVRLSRAKREGEVLMASDVETMPLVMRNDWAVLTTTVGTVSLATKVRVRQDGVLGQVVHVKPPMSSQSVSATVIGPKLLEIK